MGDEKDTIDDGVLIYEPRITLGFMEAMLKNLRLLQKQNDATKYLVAKCLIYQRAKGHVSQELLDSYIDALKKKETYQSLISGIRRIIDQTGMAGVYIHYEG
ncbi:hypothetical protein KY366_00285 [Candidatus Woesearchaeota archaeon]|nr:hypothetical protein [Candidatus Woesearchaeota archaeon]